MRSRCLLPPRTQAERLRSQRPGNKSNKPHARRVYFFPFLSLLCSMYRKICYLQNVDPKFQTPRSKDYGDSDFREFSSVELWERKANFLGCLSPSCPRVTVPRDPGPSTSEMQPRLYLPISRPGSGGWSPWRTRSVGAAVRPSYTRPWGSFRILPR